MSKINALGGWISFLLYPCEPSELCWRITDPAQVLAKYTDSVWVRLWVSMPSCLLPMGHRLDQPFGRTIWQHPIKWQMCLLKNHGELIARKMASILSLPTSITLAMCLVILGSYFPNP